MVIATQQGNHNEWMAFACWYSVHRNMSENKAAVVFPRSFKHHQFTWLNRCHVPYLAYPAGATAEQAIETLLNYGVIASPVIVLRDYQMVIREIENSVDGITTAESLPCYADCSSEEAVSVVDCRRCGKFALDEWIKGEQKHPFYRTGQLVGRNRTVNEQRVFKLWKQMAAVFDFLNRGT